MVREIKEIVKNVNFDVRLAECIACLIGLTLLYAKIPCFWASYFWLVHGWFLISLAFVMTYIFEQPNFGMEIITVGMYSFPMTSALMIDFSTDNLCPFIIAILMQIDMFFLLMNRPK